VSAGHSERGRRPRPAAPRCALALLAAAWVSGCSPQIEVRPFRVELTSAGAPWVPGGPLSVVSGVASREGPGSLVIAPVVAPAGAPAEVTIRFDTSTGAALPATLGGDVDLIIDYDPAATDPEGAPLPVRGLRVSDASGVRFILVDSAQARRDGRPQVSLVALQLGGEDVPLLETVASYAEFEPSSCGDRYYDLLRVKSPNLAPLFLLGRGEQGTGSTTEGAPPWTVLHVLSWHRSGHLCTRKPHAWIQVAEWR